MSGSFEERLKQKLEQSSPEELGYRPDREQLWHKVVTRQKRRSLPLRLWLSHAAAIAAGLLIGGFFLATYKDREAAAGLKPGQATAVVQTQQPQAAENTNAPDKAPVTPSVATVQPATRHQLQQAHNPQPAKGQHPAPIAPVTTQQQVITAAVPAPTPEPVVARVEPTKTEKAKVLHLMDIDNENTRALRSPRESNNSWAWMLPRPTGSDGTSFSQQLSEHLFHSKN